MKRNGIDSDALAGLAAAVHDSDSAAAAVVVRSRHRWRGGLVVDGEAEMIQGGQARPRAHTFRTDWPPPIGGDAGPTPGAESLLAALGACVATTCALQATARGIVLEDLEVFVEGRFGLTGVVHPGRARPAPSGVAVTVTAAGEVDEATVDELVHAAEEASPVVQALRRPVPVTVRSGHDRSR